MNYLELSLRWYSWFFWSACNSQRCVQRPIYSTSSSRKLIIWCISYNQCMHHYYSPRHHFAVFTVFFIVIACFPQWVHDNDKRNVLGILYSTQQTWSVGDRTTADCAHSPPSLRDRNEPNTLHKKVVIVDLLRADYDLMTCHLWNNVLFGRWCSSQIHRLSHHKRARTVCTSTQYESAPISQVQHPSSVLDKNILPFMA